MINQLAYKTKSMKGLIKGNDTQKSYEEMVTAVFMLDDFENESNLSEEILDIMQMTGFDNMFENYVKIAIRNLIKYRT